MKIAYLYPETLPSKKARTISAINTSCSLSSLVDTTLLYEKSGDDILDFYDKKANLKLIPISKKFIIRSNKIFNNNLKKHFDKFDLFYVRHLKAAEFLIKNNQKVIYECHEFFQDTNPNTKDIENYVLNNARGVVVINEYLKSLFLKRFKNKNIKVIRNGSGFEFDYMPKDFSSIDEIYYIGSFQPWKGVEFLVENMKNFPHIALNIIGDGDRSKIVDIIDKYNLTNINFLGFKNQNDIKNILKDTKITIIPNLPVKDSEFSTPIKLYEYMISSNIVLSAKTTAIQEIIEDEQNGFLYKAGDHDSFTAKLNHILNLDPKILKDISQNAHSCVQKFTWDNRAKDIVEFIKRLDED
jgi:glycosyltransferase involved in cell wall biosynthesis